MASLSAEDPELDGEEEELIEVDDDFAEMRYEIDPSQRLMCRLFENEYPEIEEVVMVNVRNIAEMGAYVTLLEVITPYPVPWFRRSHALIHRSRFTHRLCPLMHTPPACWLLLRSACSTITSRV